MARETTLKFLLCDMTKRWMAKVVRKARGLYYVGIDPPSRNKPLSCCGTQEALS